MIIFLVTMVVLIVAFGLLSLIGEYLATRTPPKITEAEWREFERQYHAKHCKDCQ